MLDAIFLNGLTRELSEKLTGGRIERIQQPARGTVVLTVKSRGRGELFIGGSSGAPRIYLASESSERPQEPPMFCMLLRKHLTGARILEITQPSMDRLVRIRMSAPGMFGEGEERTVTVELMGRTANLILTDGEGIITDCLYRVGSLEERRAVLPGMRYVEPPMQLKSDLMALDEDGIGSVLEEFDGNERLDRCVLGAFLGISPLTSRELCHRACGDVSPRVSEVRARDGLPALERELAALRDTVLEGRLEPWLLVGPDGEPMDFSYMPITQYGTGYTCTKAESFSALLDGFYSRRDSQERRRQRSRELTKTVKNARDRTARRLGAQRLELRDTEKRDWYRECGDIITANIYLMRKGQRELEAEDFYSETGGTRRIPLDPLKTPQQNAAKYYKDYNRAKSARAHLTEQITLGEAELEYLDSVLEELDRAETERDLLEIRQELTDAGYLRVQDRGRREKRRESAPMRFVSDSGLLIRVGRNNAQNDRLTLRDSAKTDLWLHAQKMPGSHVVISREGGEIDARTVEQAASLAAYYSQGRASGKVSVDVTEVRQIKKPNGARPGMVIYHTYRTVQGVPDEALAERLRVR